MATLGPESARLPLAQLAAPSSIQNHICGANLPHNRGLERALEEAAASGVLNLSCRKMKEFPRTAANHDLSDTVEAGEDSATLCLWHNWTGGGVTVIYVKSARAAFVRRCDQLSVGMRREASDRTER